MITPLQAFFISLIFNVFFAIVLWRYPSALKLAFGKGYAIVFDKSREFKIIPAKFRAEGAVETKDYGIVRDFDPEDVGVHNGKPAILFYSPYSKAVRIKLMPLLRRLRKLGIETFAQLGDKIIPVTIVENGEKKTIHASLLDLVYGKLNIAENPGIDEEVATLVSELRKLDFGILLKELEPIRVSDLVNWVHEVNPVTEKALIEREVQKERRKHKWSLGNIMIWVIAIIVIVMGFALAYKMIMSGSLHGVTEAVKSTTSNMPVKIK